MEEMIAAASALSYMVFHVELSNVAVLNKSKSQHILASTHES